jgi:osomolarity two-component system, response regulator SSK1
MRIPLLRSLSGTLIGSSGERRRSKSRSSRSRRLDSGASSSAGNTNTNPSTANTNTGTPVLSSKDPETPPPPVPPIPSIPSITTTSPKYVPAAEPNMLRKIWVKRPGASATRVEVNDEDLVDNVRDAILHKYANSLGRSIDSPDIVLKIVARDPASRAPGSERTLGPEEPIGRTLDEHFPGGQTIEEALIIDVPQRRTPKPSPRPGNHHAIQYYVPEQYRPDDAAQGYFPPMPVAHSPQVAHLQTQHGIQSMAILNTGQLPAMPMPSPGGSSARARQNRPKYARQHTSSPTILHSQHPNGAALGALHEELSDSAD